MKNLSGSGVGRIVKSERHVLLPLLLNPLLLNPLLLNPLLLNP